jgi:membrane peptidoglycan carboxypeptidase
MRAFRRGRPAGWTIARLVGAVITCGLLAAAMLLPFVGGIGLAADTAATHFLNTTCDVVVTPAQQTTTVLGSDGKTVIATLFAQNRQDIPLTQVPIAIQKALVSTEDRRFYSHHGVDLRGILRAAVHNGDGSNVQGGSTLTMQYVKQIRYYQAKTDAERAAAIQQNLQRKLEDARCALNLEKKYTKAQILDGYLNIAFFGENSYGIQTAARTYFGVAASALTLPQGAMLVGLLQSPTAFDPFNNPELARQRRDVVLDNMVSTGDLTAAQATHYKSTPLALSSSTPPPLHEGCANASPLIKNVGFFCDYVVNWLENQGGVPEQELLTGGLRITTTLDVSLQNAGQTAIWKSGLDPKSPTALVMPSVDPRSGAVTTMITSRHYGLRGDLGQTSLPLFTAGYAGSGSTYKYFTTLAALKLGVQPNFTLTTGSNAYTVRNCPVDPAGTTAPYTTHNAGTYNATLPLADALPESVNTYFVGMEDQLFGCDVQPIVQTALSLGMTTLNAPETPGAPTTIAQAVVAQHQAGFTLGFAPTSPLELSAAYGAVANDGVFCPPTPIARITSATGAPVAYQKAACSRQFDPQIARTMVHMMTVDTTSYQGTAASYFQNWYGAGGSLVASKTGTNNDNPTGPDGGNGNSALWFVGVTPTLVSAAALINPTAPTATVTGLPADVTNNGSDVFGAYASTYWLDAYGPGLQSQHWIWPDSAAIAGASPVPDLTGQSPSAAADMLSSASFGIATATVRCGSPQPAGQVAYYGPHLAAPGSTITVCLSNGVTPSGYYVPSSGSGQGTASSSPPPTTGASSASSNGASKPRPTPTPTLSHRHPG